METDERHDTTAVASDLRGNPRFDAEPLGLRVVTRRVDVDDTTTHHPRYRTRTEESGTALASVPVDGARPGSAPGIPGGTHGPLADGGADG